MIPTLKNPLHEMSSLTLPISIRHRFVSSGGMMPVLLYAATWTLLLTVTVAIASFVPELAFVSAISATSSFSKKCGINGDVRVPLDLPGEVLCLPADVFVKSKVDLIVPPVFAAVVVVGSAWVVRSMGLWEHDEAQ